MEDTFSGLSKPPDVHMTFKKYNNYVCFRSPVPSIVRVKREVTEQVYTLPLKSIFLCKSQPNWISNS